MYVVWLLSLFFVTIHCAFEKYPYPEKLRQLIKQSRKTRQKSVKCPDCAHESNLEGGAIYSHWAEHHGRIPFFECMCGKSFYSAKERCNHQRRYRGINSDHQSKKARKKENPITLPEWVEELCPSLLTIVNKQQVDDWQYIKESPNLDKLQMENLSEQSLEEVIASFTYEKERDSV